MNKYNIGQIFYDGTCPSDLADFCNNSQGTENACYIKEIEPLDGKRRFQIVPNDPIPEEEIAHQRIMEIQKELNLNGNPAVLERNRLVCYPFHGYWRTST